MTKPSGEPSPEQIARMNRQRLAAAEGAKAMEDAAKKAADVRANMARLRALRLAKEADATREELSVGTVEKKAKAKRRAR